MPDYVSVYVFGHVSCICRHASMHTYIRTCTHAQVTAGGGVGAGEGVKARIRKMLELGLHQDTPEVLVVVYVFCVCICLCVCVCTSAGARCDEVGRRYIPEAMLKFTCKRVCIICAPPGAGGAASLSASTASKCAFC